MREVERAEVVDLNVIVKADVQGSLQALDRLAAQAAAGRGPRQHRARRGAGGITENDVTLAMASDAIIVGFNVRPDARTRELAEKEGVDIRLYRVIYDAIDDIKAALSGLLKPEERERSSARPRSARPSACRGWGSIAGSYVRSGAIRAQRARPPDPRRRRRLRRQDRRRCAGSRTTSPRSATGSSAGSAWRTTRTSRRAT